MKKFIVLYQSTTSAEEMMTKSTPEEQKAGMDAWMAWSKKAGSAVIDLGLPLGNGAHLEKSGASKSKSQVSGFSILQAESIKEVSKVLEGHPHFMMPGNTIEVLEGLPMPGM